ncbi:MAG: hypothetical protein GQE15_26315 [Archangiaceae bacterium]|nr:hypothetical protein [Archangiaceae bacterium]
MPNCDFYAAGDDFHLIVDFVLRETSCRVFELTSRPNTRVREFRSADALVSIRRAGAPWPPLLVLWPVSANPNVRFRRVNVAAQGRRRAWWREEPEGWGLIQLYLVGPRGRSLSPSHTNHNTAERAARWRSTYPDLDAPSSWDFGAVTRESSRLNRFIRSQAVLKYGSRPVLPGAAALFEAGVERSLN